jgi:Fe-S cluster assembly scaffold protein SufB
MNEMDMVVNRLPASTWNFLHMNDTAVQGVAVDGEGSVDGKFSSQVVENGADASIFGEITTGMGADVARLADAAGVSLKNFKIQGTGQTLNLSFGGEGRRMNRVGIEAEEGSSVTVFMDVAGNCSVCADREPVRITDCAAKTDDAQCGECAVTHNGSTGTGSGVGAGLAAVQTLIYAGRNSTVKLIQVQHLGGEDIINDIGGVCQDGASIKIIQLFLSGNRRYQGCNVRLEGSNSSLGIDIGYNVRGSERLDMNYVADHIGQNTTCDITVNGALKDSAFKLFRGTIDFKKGSKASVGNEKEDVLIIDETCVNQTIPLILCAEEDVVGNHGATIGRPDEETLFYLESRGIDREHAIGMLANSKLDAVKNRIEDEDIRAVVEKYMEGVRTDDGAGECNS